MDKTIICRIKFYCEFLETFLLYEIAIGAIIAYLRVIGSPEPVRIVTVNVVVSKWMTQKVYDDRKTKTPSTLV